MPQRSLEQEIDRLYQLPLNQFTADRNALAKELAGEDAKRVKALSKPSMPAWAVNQLYWRDRGTYDALVEAAERLRAAHRAVLGGRKADLRAADAAHRNAMKAALTSTLRLVSESGHTVSSAAHTDISRTLEALPADGAPGRLAGALRPEGFEALQGMPISPRKVSRDQPERAAPATPPESIAKESKAAAERQRREAERRRQEAERARQAERAKEREARALVARVQKRLAAAEKKETAARTALERAEKETATLRRELQTLKGNA